MNKAKKIVGILVVVLMTLCSCTTETVEQTSLLKKIVEVSVDGTSNTTNLIYDGNKIVTIDKVNQLLKFYYTGNFITKVVELDKTTQHTNTLDYSYSTKGQLVEIISSDNYLINYVYNNDGSVSYEKLTKDSTNPEIKNYHGILYFQNGNLVKDDKTQDDAGSGILIKNTINIQYDYKNNALKNILGFTKLLDFSRLVSANNEVVSTESYSVKNGDNDQITSSIKRMDSQCQYNSNGYPTEIVSEKILFGGTDSKHLKSQLFYN